MTDETAAAIYALLVDVRNYAGTKSVKLTIHVPEEQAAAVLEAFGWPTAANPVEVAIARMGASTAVRMPTKGLPKPKRHMSEMSYAEQSALLCQDYAFRTFLRTLGGAASVRNQNDAAEFIRDYCGVNSRSDITHDSNAGRRWTDLLGEWQRYKTRTMQDE